MPALYIYVSYICICVSLCKNRCLYTYKYITNIYIPALSPPATPFDAVPPEPFSLRLVEVFGTFDAGSVWTMAVISFLATLKLNISRRKEGN